MQAFKPININSEVGVLNTVILGIASNRNKIQHLNNPKYAEIVKKGKAPTESELIEEVEGFKKILEQFDVEVLRPKDIPNCDQIFCRDIGFAIGNDFFYSRMKKEPRQLELSAIEEIIPVTKNVHIAPEDTIIEGGDVIVHKDYVFIGLSDRTNQKGVDFVKEKLQGKKEVITFPLKATTKGKTNILHLDCAFQPIGSKNALIYQGGFESFPEALYDIFGAENLLKVTQHEMYELVPNVLSINPELVVIDSTFTRLAKELVKKNIKPYPINYKSVSKLGGLFRCSTCPLNRNDF